MSGALTRILNNQIYNATIVASQKIQPGSIVGSLFASNVTIPGDLLIAGNLNVLGSSQVTAVASTNTYVNDPLIVLNNGFAGTNSYDEGFVFNRGTSTNQAFIWSETFKEFRLIATTETGTTYGNVSASGLAPLSIGSLNVGGFANVGGINITGAITGANLNVTGNILSSTSIAQLHTGSTATFGNVAAVTVGNVGTQFNGAAINLSGNVLASTIIAAYHTGSTATFGNIAAVTIGNTGAYLNGGTLNISGNVLLGLTQASALNATIIGNITPSTAAFTTLTSSGITTVTNATAATALGEGAFRVTGGASILGNLWIGGNLNVLGNSYTVTSNAGVFYGNAAGFGALYAGVVGFTPQAQTTIQVTSNFNGYAQLNMQNINNGALASSDFIVTADNGNANDTYVDLGLASSTYNYPGFTLIRPNDGYLIAYGNSTTGGGNLLLASSLNDIVFSVNGNGNISTASEFGRIQASTNSLVIKSATASTNTTSGAIQVAGGVGIGGRLYVGQGIQNTAIGNVTPGTAVFTYAIAGNVQSGFIGNTGTAFTGASLNVTGNISTALINAGQINTTGNILATAGTFNGVTVNGNQSINGGYLNVQGNILGQTGTLSALILNSTTNSTQSTGTGALQVAGGASFGQDVFVQGNIYAANIIGTGYQYLAVQDPLLYLQGNVVYPYNYDLGFYSHFIGGAGNTYQHTGMIRDNLDGYWKIFSNVGEPSGGQVDFTNAIYDGVKAGNLVLTNPVASTSTSTGALQVAGGAGIGGNIFQGGAYHDTSSSNFIFAITPTTVDAFKSASTINIGSTSGTVTIQNPTIVGASLTQTLFDTVATTINFGRTSNITLGASSGYTTLQGGANIQLTTDATNTATGALRIAGGAGIGGNIFQGGAYYDTSSSNFIFAATPTSVNAFPAASTLNIGVAAGTTLLRSTTVGGTQATQNLYNSTTTTLNFAGAATSLVMGATAGNTTIRNSLGLNGVLFANLATDTSSTTTGAIIVPNGGISVSGNAYVGKNLYIGGSTAFNANLTVPTIVAVDSGATYAQMAMINNTLTGSADFIAYPGDYPGQSNDHGWMDMGFTGTGFNDPNYTITKPQDGYLFASGANSSVGGNLVLATDYTGNFNDIVFGVGSFNASSEVLRLHGNVGTSGNAWLKYTTVSTLWNNGALRIDGGVGIGGNFNVKGNSAIALGLDITNVYYNQNAIQVATIANNASRISIQNISNGSLASSEFAAVADTGSNVANQYLMGIASSNYSALPIIKPLDSYNLATGGNLVVAATKDIVFIANGISSVGVRISATNSNVGIQYSTVATSPTTGALTVNGGVGINSNLWVANGAVINNSQTSDNFTVKGATSTALIYANSNLGAVVVGGSGPGASGGNTTIQPGASFKVDSHDSMLIPVGTTAQRPSNSGNVDVQGMVRFNSTINNLEFFDGSAWQATGSSFTVISDRQFAGNTAYGNVDGTNTTFTIQANATTSSTLVSINGVIQFPVLAYSISGATMTFTEAPALNDVIDVRVLATTTVVSTLASGNGLNQFITDNTGSSIWTGTSSTTERVLIDPVGTINLLTGNDTTYTQTPVNVPSAATPVLIDTFAKTAYSTAKYIVSAKKDATNFESFEALLISDQSGNAYVTTYAIVNNGTALGTLSANVVGANVNLYYTSTTLTNANVKVMTTYIV